MTTTMNQTPQDDKYGLRAAVGNVTDFKANGATSGAQNTSGTTSQSGSTNTVGTTNSTTTTNSLSSASQAALDKLIAQLLSGGTPEMKQQNSVRTGEVSTVQGIRSGYSKGAAFSDAAGLVAAQLRKALEAALPGISRAAEDAGSSGGALRALLMQNVAQNAADSSAALGVQTATNYGNISANLSNVLENLTKVNPQATEALIQALNVAKGATSTSTTSGVTTGAQNTTQLGNTTGNTNTTGTSTENKDYAPFQVAANNSPLYYGPSTVSAFGGASNDAISRAATLQALASLGTNDWSNYQI